jgi:hypothetical protein
LRHKDGTRLEKRARLARLAVKPVVLQGHSRCEYVINRVRGTRDANMFTTRMA